MNEEANRKLMMWLGWRPGKGICCNVTPNKKRLGWHHPNCKCKESLAVDCDCFALPGECSYCQADCSHTHIEECRDLAFDFFTSQTASALLLQKILAIPEAAIHMMWKDGQFQLTVFLPHRPTPSGRDGGETFRADNRQAAVANCALALIEKEKTHV